MVSEGVRVARLVSVVGGNYPWSALLGPLLIAGAQCPLSLSLSPLTVSSGQAGVCGPACQARGGCWVPAPGQSVRE